MFLECLDGTSLDRLSKGSHKKVLIQCDWEGCEETWEAEYRRWHGKEKHFCARHRQIGKKHTFETRLKLSLMNLGKNNPAYKHGKWSSTGAGRKNIYYDLWREIIRERAKGICQVCREKPGIETHHSETAYIDIVKQVRSQLTEEELKQIDEGIIGLSIGLHHIIHDVPGIWVCKECHLKLSSKKVNSKDKKKAA